MSKTNLFTLHSIEQKGKSLSLAEGSWFLPRREHLTFISSHCRVTRVTTNTAISETKNMEQMRSSETPGEEQAAGPEHVHANKCRMASRGPRVQKPQPWLHYYCKTRTWRVPANPANPCFNPYFQSFIKKKKKSTQSFAFSVQTLGALCWITCEKDI